MNTARDYKTFFVEGETKDQAVGMPVLFKGRSKRVGIVLSHGYMAAPLEVQGLAKYLQHKGFWVLYAASQGPWNLPGGSCAANIHGLARFC